MEWLVRIKASPFARPDLGNPWQGMSGGKTIAPPGSHSGSVSTACGEWLTHSCAQHAGNQIVDPLLIHEACEGWEILKLTIEISDHEDRQ
eukprot:7859928-Alexandrium_andersonii.AAC.1